MSSEKRRSRSGSTERKRAIYCREKDLPRLTGLWPGEIDPADMKGRKRIVAILKNKLRLERQRGKSGHWCYDINRHLTLKHALTHELAELKRLSQKPPRFTSVQRADKAASAPLAQTARSSHPALFLELPTASSS
jgi:hypothetical protein